MIVDRQTHRHTHRQTVRQTDRQTDPLITILRSPIGSRVTINTLSRCTTSELIDIFHNGETAAQ